MRGYIEIVNRVIDNPITNLIALYFDFAYFLLIKKRFYIRNWNIPTKKFLIFVKIHLNPFTILSSNRFMRSILKDLYF